MGTYKDLTWAKIFEGLASGLQTGLKYRNDRQTEADKLRIEQEKLRQEEELKKLLMDRKLENDAFNRDFSIEKAANPTTYVDGAGNLTTVPGMDPQLLESFRQRSKLMGNGQVGIVPDQPVRSLIAGVMPPTPPPIPSYIGTEKQEAPIVGKMAGIKSPETNISRDEFLKNPDKYKNTPNLKVIAESASAAPKAENQLDAIYEMKSLLDKIPADAKTSLTAGTSKYITGGKRGSIGSDEAKQYMDAMPGVAVGVYRALTGDTRLSDDDAKARALPFLPQIFPVVDTQEVRDGKINRIVRALSLKASNPDSNLSFEDWLRKADDAGTQMPTDGSLTPEEQQELQSLREWSKTRGRK